LKLLKSSILLISVILLTLVVGKANAFSHFSLQQIIRQDTTKKDTTKKTGKNNSSIDQKVEYKAEDSVKMSADKNIVYLYGNARVIYGDFELDASYIKYDKKKNTIFASGVKDPKTGRYTGRPIFKSGADGTAIADSIFYNSETTLALNVVPGFALAFWLWLQLILKFFVGFAKASVPSSPSLKLE
jgi:hypothetical protein